MKHLLWLFCSLNCFAAASQLEVYDDKELNLLMQTADQKEMAALLNRIGVRFEQ
ncbi:MAG: hypothetical protein JSR57_11290, partial [Verrucomicrobia bacterium]|nr:hypothetical protein [Verrucomicrobiota bacterium]